jgi:hypothetical protein
MKRFSLSKSLVGFLLIINGAVFGQKVVIGKVVDAENKKPIKDAVVSIEGSTIETITNILGFFQLTVDSTDNLIIEANGFERGRVAIPTTGTFQIGLIRQQEKDTSTSQVIEVSAYPPGGMAGFYDYVAKNIKMPKECRAISGQVFVEFVVDSTGYILPEDIKIVKSLSKPCDAEVVRLIKGSPKWTPGTLGNKRTRQKMTLPIRFN